MTAWLKIGVGVAALALVAGPQSAFAADAAHPTVVELFQSQGCSSCPPAEANVGAISDRPDVLALAFEVDYWDRLGWKDTFSKAGLDRAPIRLCAGDGPRWRLYASGGRQRPGRGRRFGAGRAFRAYQPRRSGRRRSECRLFGRRGHGRGGAAPAGGADVWLARYIPRTVEVAIPRGENAGHTLPYKDVVREMVLLGHWRGEAATFPAPGASDPAWRRRQSCRARAAGRSSRRRDGDQA